MKNIEAQKIIDRAWETLFSREISRPLKFLLIAVIMLIDFGISYYIRETTGRYFPSLPILTVVLISIFSGLALSICSAIVVSISYDYFFTPPYSQIFESIQSVEEFSIICGSALLTATFLSSLRSAVRSISLAKRAADKAKHDSELAKLEAEKANKLKSEFISNISHEIRTPIHVIMGMISLVKKTDLNEHQAHYIDNIKKSSDNLLTLINSVLDISKMEAGRMQVESIPFHLNVLLNDIETTFQTIAEQHGLHFKSVLGPANSYRFVGDPHRIKQVLINFIGNAIKFTPKGTVCLKIDIQPSEPGSTSRITFSVVDTGVGIPKAKHDHLFSPFTQAESSTSRKYGGSGLGLAISKQLVELMGGTIGFDSKEGEGSSFYFTLNLKSESDEIPKPIEPTSTAGTPHLTPSNRQHFPILVAEDNEMNQEIIRKILQNEGYRVDVVENGIKALSAVEKKRYALILMDCQMPEMDGYETTEHLRAQGISAPIIAITAHAFVEDRERCKRAGMSDYITKPFNSELLIETLDRHLEQKKA